MNCRKSNNVSNKPENILPIALAMLDARLPIALNILLNQLRTLSSQPVSVSSSPAPSPVVFPPLVVLLKSSPPGTELEEKAKHLHYNNHKHCMKNNINLKNY